MGPNSLNARSRRLANLVGTAGTAVVVFVSQSFVDWALALAVSPLLSLPGVDDAIRERANEIVDRGVEIAERCGFDASGQVITTGRPAWHALLEAATEMHARMIVAGSHGNSPLTGGMLGSAASGLVQRSTIPVLIIPSDHGPYQ